MTAKIGNFWSVGIGCLLGLIHGIILWSAKITFSSILIPSQKVGWGGFLETSYSTAFTNDEIIRNSLAVAGAADIIIIVTIISAIWWLPFIMRSFEEE